MNDYYDFDFDDVLLAGRHVRMVDCGDVDKLHSGGKNPERIIAAIRTILSRGAKPIVLGTDEGGCIPVIRAYDVYGSLWVVHIDAHIDWRDERNGVREGYSNPLIDEKYGFPIVQSIAGTLSNLGLILKLIFDFAEVSILSIATKLIKKETDKTYLGKSVSGYPVHFLCRARENLPSF